MTNEEAMRRQTIAEYVDKKTLRDALYDADAITMEGVKILNQFPAADVVPVRHGRWVMTLYATTSKRGRIISSRKFACSECGYSNGRKQNNYCPNCGAKMDKEKSE